MWGEGFKRDQRSVSEIYGTVLIISLAFLTALLLVGAGWVIVDQLTTESDDSLAQDSMQNVDHGIEQITGGAANGTTTFEFPERTGTDVSANEEEGVLNVTIQTANETLWNRTVAENNNHDKVGTRELTLGTIRHQAEDNGITAYQGGGLWRQPQPGGTTFILSEPNIDFTGDALDLGVVSLTDLEAITEGAEVRASHNARAGTQDDMQAFMAQYWTDRYNPAIAAPVEINVTIESQYADGWAKYARERMTVPLEDENVIYPFNGDDEKVRLVFGEIGGINTPWNPDFGPEVLYSGTSDMAYTHYNASAWPPGAAAHGEVTGNATYFSADASGPQPLNDNNNVLALYNESGQWLIYDNSTGGGKGWTDSDGNKVDPDNTEAIVEVDNPSNQDTWFRIKPPSEMPNERITPVCIVADPGISPNSADNMTDYLDEEGEGCLANMVGLNATEEMVIDGSPDFDIEITDTRTPGGAPLQTDDSNPAIYPNEQIEVDVEIENVGDDTGQMPLGVYVINESNWEDGNLTEAYFAGGNSSSELVVDDGNSTTNTYIVDGERFMIDDEWVIFATTGDVSGIGDIDWTKDGPDNRTFAVEERPSNFAVEGISPNGDLQEGQESTIEIEVNETEGELSEEETQTVRLEADDVLVGQTEVTLGAGEGPKTVAIDWTPRDGSAGNVTLTASTFDDSEDTVVTVSEAPVDGPAFDIEDMTVLDSNNLTVGDTVEVDVTIRNYGTESGTSTVTLGVAESGGSSELVDAYEPSTEISPGEERTVRLNWDTSIGDSGTYNLTAEVDGNESTRQVEIDALTESNPEFNVDINEDASVLSVDEGEEIVVSADISVNDTGDLPSTITQDVVLENFDGGPVTAKEVVLSESSNYKTTVELTWNTTVGDANPDLWNSIDSTGDDDAITGNITVAVGEDSSASDTAEATIFPKEGGPRDPVDVMFALDETGSMGTYNHTSELRNKDLPYTVNDGEVVVFEYRGSDCDIECQTEDYRDSEWFIPGDTITKSDWNDFKQGRPSNDLRISSKVVADESSYCDEYGCYDPYGDRIKAAQAALSGLNETLGDRAGALEFNTSANTYQEITNNLTEVNESLRIFPDGSTDIASGIEKGEEELLDSDIGNKQVLIVLTDGEDNAGGDPVEQAEQVSDDIPIYTVGFGGANITTLQNISEGGSGEGEQYFADQTEELAAIFEDIVDEVTEPQRPEFTIDSITPNQDPVSVGDELTVDVTLNNTGEAESEGTVVLRDPRGTYVDSANEVIAPDDGPVTIQMTWNTTGAKTGEHRELTATTVDDTANTTVTVRAGDVGTDFQVLSINEDNSELSTDVGGQVIVNATIENVGPEGGAQSIFLRDSNGFVKAVERDVKIGSGESKQVDLVWDTEQQDADGSETNYELSVETEDGSQSDSTVIATITDPNQAETDVLIDDVTILNEDDSVNAGNNLEVNVTLRTQDDIQATDELVWLEVFNDNGTRVAQPFLTADIPKTGTTNVTLTWDTTNQLPGPYEFDAHTNDDADPGHQVTVEPAETPLRVKISNTNAAITEGEKLEVVVKVENTDPDEAAEGTLLLKDDRSGTIVDVAEDIEVDAGETELIVLTWYTRYGDGDDENPVGIRAEIANTEEDDKKYVQIDEIRNNLDRPSLPEPQNPLDIDLDEIEIGT